MADVLSSLIHDGECTGKFNLKTSKKVCDISNERLGAIKYINNGKDVKINEIIGIFCLTQSLVESIFISDTNQIFNEFLNILSLT